MIVRDTIGNILKDYFSLFLIRILKRQIIKPWMRSWEIEVIEKILVNIKPKKSLEWGAGYSTLYFSKFLEDEAKWISIEHQYEWYLKVKDLANKKGIRNVEIYYVGPNRSPWSGPWNDGSYDDFKDYVEFPSRFGKFDFILIDGRARRACMHKAYDLIDDNGVVVLHDANRERYHEAFDLYKYQILFTDHRKMEGGIWIGSKKLPIENVIEKPVLVKLSRYLGKR